MRCGTPVHDDSSLRLILTHEHETNCIPENDECAHPHAATVVCGTLPPTMRYIIECNTTTLIDVVMITYMRKRPSRATRTNASVSLCPNRKDFVPVDVSKFHTTYGQNVEFSI